MLRSRGHKNYWISQRVLPYVVCVRACRARGVCLCVCVWCCAHACVWCCVLRECVPHACGVCVCACVRVVLCACVRAARVWCVCVCVWCCIVLCACVWCYVACVRAWGVVRVCGRAALVQAKYICNYMPQVWNLSRVARQQQPRTFTPQYVSSTHLTYMNK